MTLLIENQLFPCVSYFKKLVNYNNLLLEQYEAYKKMSFRNRYVISGANGLIHLTVPIAGGREQKRLMKDVEIDFSDKWPLKHWRAIVSSYNKSPYFENYEESLKNLIFSGNTNLADFNLSALRWIIKALKIEINISLTSEYKNTYENGVDYRDYFLPKNFQSGKVEMHDKYIQVFESRFGFQANLSILDLLFAEGPNSKCRLEKSVK